MARKVNVSGIALIKQWEGFKPAAYRDLSGIWTIGYGHTAAAGDPVPMGGMEITEPEATRLLIRDLEQYEQAVDEAVEVELTDNQFSALVSFCYNVGTTAFRRSTLLKRLNVRDYDAVPAELMKWVYTGKKRSAGLANRRAAEIGLWVKGAYVASRDERAGFRKAHAGFSPEIIMPAIGALSGLGGITYGNGVVQWALAVVMVGAFAIGGWWFLQREKKNEG